MATNNNSNRYPSEKGRFFKGKTFILLVGLLLGAGIMVAVYKTSVYFSSDESCMMCHVHPHAEDSWKLSKHVNNGSGVKTHCVACHLPPQSDTWNHYTAKAKLGLKDVWSCGFRLEHQVGTGTCRQIYSERILQGMPSELVPGRD